jgi:glycosyltransferase involved in cell wall biosynthesis
MIKRILMIAYHFPPIKGSSGIQRTLKFCQYLPQFGWQPMILSVNERAYETTSQEQMGYADHGLTVKRAFALDSARHLAIYGRYPRLLAIPDRWVSWLFGGVLSGLQLIRKNKPSILWSTYPIATAHLIGYVLHRLTGLPWVADLRDPMVQEGYPEDTLQWKAFKWIEDRIARRASAICFTSPSAIDEFMNKHRGIVEPGKLYLIENGYDEDCFAEAEKIVKANPPIRNRQVILVHSGVIYPSERDPRPFFQAVLRLKQSGLINSSSLRVILRATGHDDYLAQHIQAAGLDDIIELAPPIPYVDALAEMLTADGLILLQAGNCNYQIPAKLYEYIRAGRPIFGLTDYNGDTANIISTISNATLANIMSSDDISKKLEFFIDNLTSGYGNFDSSALLELERFSRQNKTRDLVNILESII